MPNQRAIAAVAGVSQAAVSKALRGDRSIPESTRLRIQEIARELGYRPNAYVSTLMTHIRSGRPLRDKGCIAVLVWQRSREEWLNHIAGYAWHLQLKGLMERAETIGYTTECFFLESEDGHYSRIDRILRARGISGIVLMPPIHRLQKGKSEIQNFLSWENYAISTIAYTWKEVVHVDSIGTHHRHNVDRVYEELLKRGYERIGFCLPPEAVNGVDCSWYERFLLWNERLPESDRIPLFVGKPGQTPIANFKAWLDQWRPQALACLIGHEKEWLDELGITVPGEIAIACINRPPNSHFSGVEENHEMVGAAAMDFVAARIERNEFGLPPFPKLTLIEGSWVDGGTLMHRGLASPHS